MYIFDHYIFLFCFVIFSLYISFKKKSIHDPIAFMALYFLKKDLNTHFNSSFSFFPSLEVPCSTSIHHYLNKLALSLSI